MTDQTIIDDAKEAGAAIFDNGKTIVVHGKYGSGDANEFLNKFAQLRDARAKASKQVQGEAVAIVDVEGKIHLNMTDLNAIRKAGKEINLYASPPQPQTVANALEKASNWKPNELEILKYAADEELFLFSSQDDLLAIANGIIELIQIKINRNLITTQPPIQGNIKGEK